MAYSDFAPPRRSRRRRRVVVLIVLLVIVGVLALAVRYRTERRESIDYLATAEEVALLHAEMADQLGTLLQELGQEDRPTVVLRLESLAADAKDSSSRLEELVVTRPVAEAAGLMAVAVSSWSDGIALLDEAIVAILDAEVGDLSADEDLRAAFEMLSLGDRAYEMAVASVAGLDPDIVSMQFPAVTYTTGEYVSLYDAVVIAERLRRLGGLSETRDVALSAVTIPEPVSEGVGGVWAIPFSEELALEVVVSNTGNVVVEKITVIVTLQQVGVAEEVAPLGQLIPSIEPGQSERLLFENLAAETGIVYTIDAEATIEGGGDTTDDNSFNLVFERNAE
ncbi:MAG: hypothetical protein GY926_02250 [bacterium]|nr:hypothetical protein [bacterium]MCP4964035.1 hypothetical protein [bacterium]